MLLSFANREGTHQRSYALLNDTLGLPEEEYSAFLEYKQMSDKIEFMQKEHGEAYQVMASIKKTFDPNGILNPGKVVKVN